MNKNWYPGSLRVAPEGTKGTYDFMESVYLPAQHLQYAEFGIYKGGTAINVAKKFPNATLHLFDFEENIQAVNQRILGEGLPNRVFSYGNTQKYNDSYNWSLIKLISEQDGIPFFDYCFLDGAHTVAVDALNFFLCDRLLKVGGYMDFDDYYWALRGSSLDPRFVPEIGEQYTDEQIDSLQVKMIVDELVRRDSRYVEVVKDKVFQKIAE